jgi:hypothetical protein
LAIALIAVTANAQVTILPGSGTFVDISGTGTALAGAGDDTAHGFTSTVGNDLFPAGAIAVTSNGYLVSGAAPSSSIFTNAAITSTSTGTLVGYAAANKVLCPFWDDLYAVGAPGATLYWQEIFGVLYIQYQNIGHFATSSAAGGPGITFQVQIYQGGPCIPSIINMVYPDATFGGAQAINDTGASATVGYIGGTVNADNVQYSFNTLGSIPDGTSLVVSKSAFGLAYSSPFGAGSIQINICGGSPNGQYQLLATLNAGVFPLGWLYGIDITIPELQSQIGNFPFLGPLDGSGAFQLGPFGGLPSGLTIYSLVFNIPPASVPTIHTPAQAYTIP